MGGGEGGGGAIESTHTRYIAYKWLKYNSLLINFDVWSAIMNSLIFILIKTI